MLFPVGLPSVEEILFYSRLTFLQKSRRRPAGLPRPTVCDPDEYPPPFSYRMLFFSLASFSHYLLGRGR